MSQLLMMGPLPARVIQVLKDFLTDELAAVDFEMNDGLVTPPVLDANFFERDRLVFGTYPAISIRTHGSNPVEVRPKTFGSRVDAKHKLSILVHVTASQGNAEFLQTVMHRYSSAIIRVLCIEHDGLDTLADPTRFVEITEWLEPLSYTPAMPGQAEGAIVRSVNIPLSIRRREVRPS